MRADLILSAFVGCLIGWFWLDKFIARVKSSRFFKGSPNNDKRISMAFLTDMKVRKKQRKKSKKWSAEGSRYISTGVQNKSRREKGKGGKQK